MNTGGFAFQCLSRQRAVFLGGNLAAGAVVWAGEIDGFGALFGIAVRGNGKVVAILADGRARVARQLRSRQ